MTKKQTPAPDARVSRAKPVPQRKTKSGETTLLPESIAVDRPGFDLGGSTGKTSAGTGIGLGDNASESRIGRSLPGRRPKNQ